MKNEMICVECGKAFSFQQDEQEMYIDLGFLFEPRRCRVCRGAEKAITPIAKPEKEMHTVVCDECGNETQLPFKPKGDRPVFCKACFAKKKREFNNRSEFRPKRPNTSDV